MTHLDLDRLADLEEGLLTPDEEAAARTHLGECADCRAGQAQLSDTRSALSGLPPEEMPSAVAARIDAALSALPSTTIVPLSSRRRGWRAHPTAAGLGAAAAVAALVAALVVGRTSSHHPSTTSAGADNRGVGATTGTTTVPLPTTTASGTRYTAANMTHKVEALLAPPVSSLSAAAPAPGAAAQPTASPPVESAKRVPAALSRLSSSPGALASCVLGLEEQSQIPITEPLAIDFGEFRTPTGVKPAAVVILPGFDDPTSLGAWVVGANCTRTDVDLLNYATVGAPLSSSPGPTAAP